MERQHVIAMLQYLQRALPTVPTTAVEWESVRIIASTLENVANGKVFVEVKPVESVIPK